jgi:energy-coupling factor transporter ATP-binding protein EcfA2
VITDAVAGGATVLMASHEVDRAHLVATRTVTLAGGQIRGTFAKEPAGVS